MSFTPIALTTENFIVGYLDESNSRDQFTLAVTAEQLYSIAVIGIGQDPLLEVTVSAVDENGSPVALDVKGDEPDWFDKKFTATSSGTITFELAPMDADASGQYGLKVTKGLQNDFNTAMGAGALYHNGAWGPGGGESVTLTYGFRATTALYLVPGSDLTTFSTLTAPQMELIDLALAQWSDVSNIKFQAINPGGYSDNATMLFGNYQYDDSGGAFALLPENQGDRRSESEEGDVWFNLNSMFSENTPVPGTYSFYTIMHEIGHALGLNHPGPYNADGSEITYENSAKFFQDSGQYTIMSYFDGSNTGQLPGNINGAVTPQLFDILAIQNKYGANMQTRPGDTVYGFGSNAGSTYDFALNRAPQFSIWDGGGIDTLDVSGFSQPQTINLNPGTFSSIGGQTFNISIALNVMIENAVGGSGDDVIFGNSSENRIMAGAGHDRIKGGYANDYIDGGEGVDIAMFTGSFNQYVIGATSDGLIEVGDTVANRDGTDSLASIERLQFTNTNIALDIADAAGQAYRIYEAVLGRAPDLVGLGYWINDMDNGISLTTIAQGFIASPEFQVKYGANPSYETYVDLLYNNILDREPDTDGMNYWVLNMQKGIDTPAAVLASFSEGFENTANVAPDIANGIHYTPWIS